MDIYDDDEFEFIKAVEKYKNRNKKKFLSIRDLLIVAKSLGYKKLDEPTE